MAAAESSASSVRFVDASASRLRTAATEPSSSFSEVSASVLRRRRRSSTASSVSGWLLSAERLLEELHPSGVPHYAALSAIAEGDARKIRGIVEIDSVDADVERSMVEGIHSKMDEAHLESHHAALRRLLRAWCVLHPDVGYAQSMNLIAAFSLAIFAEDEAPAFTLFCGLMARLDPQFHAQWPPLLGFHVEVDSLIALLDEYVPELAPPKPAASPPGSDRIGSPPAAAEAAAATAATRHRKPSIWERLTRRRSAMPAEEAAAPPAVSARRLRQVREVLRLWCCRGFLPLWVGLLPVDVVYGAWQLQLADEEAEGEAEAEGEGEGESTVPSGAPRAPSTANLAIALALLRRCAKQVRAAF